MEGARNALPLAQDGEGRGSWLSVKSQSEIGPAQPTRTPEAYRGPRRTTPAASISAVLVHGGPRHQPKGTIPVGKSQRGRLGPAVVVGFGYCLDSKIG